MLRAIKELHHRHLSDSQEMTHNFLGTPEWYRMYSISQKLEASLKLSAVQNEAKERLDTLLRSFDMAWTTRRSCAKRIMCHTGQTRERCTFAWTLRFPVQVGGGPTSSCETLIMMLNRGDHLVSVSRWKHRGPPPRPKPAAGRASKNKAAGNRWQITVRCPLHSVLLPSRTKEQKCWGSQQTSWSLLA